MNEAIHLHKIIENFQFYAWGNPLDALLFSAAIFIPALFIGYFTRSLRWGAFIGLIILCSFLKPFGLQSSVLISFGAFIFVGLNALWQKDNFDLRNRPYLQITDHDFRLSAMHDFRMNGGNPEPKFFFEFQVLNHGAVPATITTITMQVHPDIAKLGSKEAIYVGPYSQDKIQQWKNIDVFPYLDSEFTNQTRISRQFFLGVPDLQKLKVNPELVQSYTDYVTQNTIQNDGIYKINTIQHGLGHDFCEHYILIQFEYFALGEQSKRKEPYWYWAIYKSRHGERGGTDFAFVESGTEQKIKKYAK